MSANHLIKISDAVIALKTEAGPVKLNQLVNTVAMARPPEALGTAGGCALLKSHHWRHAGRGVRSSRRGINDAIMKELSENLKSGNAALFVLIHEMTADKVLKGIQDAGGTVLKTSLDDSKDKALREALAKATAAEPEAAIPG
jgi:uncharacterized membrane protein